MRALAPLLAAALLLASADAATAQLRLRGTVRDTAGAAPVEGALVQVTDPWGRLLAHSVTDPSGAFTVLLHEGGNLRLLTSRPGYLPDTTLLVQAPDRETLQVEVRLTAQPLLLEPLVVTADGEIRSPFLAGFDARRRAALGTFFTRSDVEKLQPATLSDLLARVPALRVQSRGAGLHPVVRSARGTGCPIEIYMDGVRVNPGGIALSIDDLVVPADVEGVEVYAGPATVPAPFLSSSSADCGVIAVWTRRG